LEIISAGNFYLGKDKESYVKIDVHFGTFRLEYERPRFKEDGASLSPPTDQQED